MSREIEQRAISALLEQMEMKEIKSHLMASTDELEVYAVRDYGKTGVMTHTRLVAGARMHFAMQCIERWGMVAGEADGEDSAGRAKIRLATPTELVDRAFAISELLHERAAERGWLMSVPSYDDFDKALDE